MPEKQRHPFTGIALSMYADEPCRICGKPITREQTQATDFRYAGYSADGKARAAHEACWLERGQLREGWAHQ